MNYAESIKLLTSQGKFHINLGLERMQKLAEIFLNPQDKLKIVHVAGTNGKGSTCAMLAKICEENGLKTGLFTSPHIKNYTERFKINSKDISEQDFANYLGLVEKTAKENNIDLTEFEILTMMAFLYFKNEKTDIVILETGMGGRLDATNIIKKPALTIITSISSDHLDRLGKTIEEISFEKAGILKKDIPLIINKQNQGYNIIKKQAQITNSPIFTVDKFFQLIDSENNIFSDQTNNYQLSLRGINQGENLSLVIEASKYLKLEIKEALNKVVWNSRFEYIKENNLLIDAAHNADAVVVLNKNLDTYFKNKQRIFLFGLLNTKDYKEIIRNLFRNDDIIFITDGFAHNAIPKEILADEIAKHLPTAKIKPINLIQINEFKEKDVIEGIKICCGSFYLCSQLF